MMDDPGQAMQVVLVTGPAGAGRSTAINALEDLGYETIDNLPMPLIADALAGARGNRGMAFGIDTRTRAFTAAALLGLLDRLEADPRLSPQLLYLDCSVEALLRRFSETRRRHPISRADTPREAVEHEKALLADLRDRAMVLIDTSEMTPHDLRAEIGRWFDPSTGRLLRVSVQSFSYKRGVPPGLDMVFDVRFLRNPHWDPSLRAQTGREPAVAAYIGQDPRYAEFFQRIQDLVSFLLPAFVEEGKTQLSIGFGCTGGQHRSVATAEHMARVLAEGGWDVSKRHWELDRRAAGRAALDVGGQA